MLLPITPKQLRKGLDEQAVTSLLKKTRFFLVREAEFYTDLILYKALGNGLDFGKITPTELERLFLEGVIDNHIAMLFDVTRQDVVNKRYRFNIKVHTTSGLFPLYGGNCYPFIEVVPEPQTIRKKTKSRGK